MSGPRAYETDHPWITFRFNPDDKLSGITWAHLGEAFSKCQHLTGTPMQPGVAWKLGQVYMRRGALASAAIEGNTLSEEEVEEIFVNKRRLPESQQYLEQEVRNVLTALRTIRKEVALNDSFSLTAEWILSTHARLLEGLETPDYVSPGEYRTVSVGVGTYRGAPAEDVAYLMEKMCDWINSIRADAKASESEDRAFFLTFFAATLAHLYLAWIHPFGDGNGRTARLIECAILAHSGLVPWISTNVLSDFYNKTRSRYYDRLEAASRQEDVAGFVAYSAIGFRDQLRDQVRTVQHEQRKVAWVNYVHERFQEEPSTETARRRRAVVLSMPEGVQLTRKEIRFLSPQIAELYEQTSERLFKRDMGKLIDLGLIEETGRGKYEMSIWRMDTFAPRPEAGIFFPAVQMAEDPEDIQPN